MLFSVEKIAGLTRKTLCGLACLALPLLPAGPSGAAPAKAGTRIINQAITTYFHPVLGLIETVQSNSVEAVVSGVAAIEIVGFSDLTLPRSAEDQHHFTVRNTGNTAVTSGLALNHEEENGILQDQSLIWDINANGLIDGDDIMIDPDMRMELPVGTVMHVIHSFRVSSLATLGTSATTWINADTPVAAMPGGGSQETTVAVKGIGEGRVRIVEGAFEIRKSVATRVTDEGTELDYMLSVHNDSEIIIPGYSTIGDDPISIDGADVVGIIVRDTIPLNTSLLRAGPSGGFTPLFHISGTAEQAYSSAVPSDLGTVDAMAWFWPGTYDVGQSTELKFTVRAAAGLGNITVLNTGLVYHPGGPEYGEVTSNTTETGITSDKPAKLSFDHEIGTIGTDTRLIVTGGACNLTNDADTVEVQVQSGWSGDAEVVIATETGGNTGRFETGPLPLSEMLSPVQRDGVMATAPGDRLLALASCSGLELSDELVVNPGNFVFNSLTNAAVTNARVVLKDVSGREVSSTVSDGRGYYSFGEIPAGDYVFSVEPPNGLAFPSARTAFPGFGRGVDSAAGFGVPFAHAGGALMISDLPLDPVYDNALGLRKLVDRPRLATGQVAVYSMSAVNNMDQALNGAHIDDMPPNGTDIVAGSVRLDGVPLADPVEMADGSLSFDLGTIPPRTTTTLTYAMRFTALARDGKHVNTAVLSGLQSGTGAAMTSPMARAEVMLDSRGGVFSREATVIGQVFLDCDGDGVRNADANVHEPGIPGVRIITQEGLSVVTDIDGKYSLFGLRPVTHAFQIDSRTLPKGTQVRSTRATDLGRGGSRLVDLKTGELKAERFALEGCTSEVRDEIARRTMVFQNRTENGSDRMSDLPMNAGRPEARSARSEAGIATTSQLRPDTLAAAEAATHETTEPLTLEELVKAVPPAVGFVELAAETRVRRQSLTLRVKGPADLTLALSVNGAQVGADRIGEKSVWDKGNVQALEYVALQLRPGRNVLELWGEDAFGIPRGRVRAVVVAPGDPVAINIVAPKKAPASAGTSVPVVVRILDASGLPVEASSMVTLNARNASWGVTDIRPEQPGVQVFIDNGEATFDLIAPQVVGPDLLSAVSGIGRAESRIIWMPDLEERVLVGVIEGAVALNGVNDLLDHDQLDPFEDTAHGLRGELFLKGRIRGDALLTLRYSSDSDTEDRLFRDIRTDEYYPVYGDASERGYDGASASNLYVKIEKGASYVLYGDIAIAPESSAFKLGGYTRVTTGLKAHWENENTRVTVFAARTRQGQKVIELDARGISGPYDLNLADIRDGSERVELLVRDRDTGEILAELKQQRMTDYLLDYFRDAIIFNAPVAQADEDGNPISIRVTFETVDDATARYWLYGGEATWALGNETEVGVRVVHADAERNTDERERIIAAFLRKRIGERTLIEAEVARAEDGFGTVGHAGRIKLVHQGRRGTLTVEASRTERGYAPSGSTEQAGRDRMAVEYKAQLDDKNRLAARAEYLRDRVADTEVLRAEVELEHSRDPQTLIRSGLRFEHDLRADKDATRLYGTFGATWSPDPDKALTYGIDIAAPGFRLKDGYIRMNMLYQVSPELRLSAAAEVALSGYAGVQEFSHLRFGADYSLSDTMTGRTEFVTETGDVSEARLIQGFRSVWSPRHGLALSFGLEHSEGLGSNTDWLTSATFGLNWTSDNERWVGELDLEQTFERDGETSYINAGLAGQITPDLTFLGRARYAVDGRGEGSENVRNRIRVGAAYRPAEDPRLAVLAWYERRFRKDNLGRSDTHLWSVAANYQPTDDLEIRGKYAGQKEASDFGAGIETASLTQLVQAGIDWDLADDRLRLGLHASHIWDDAGFSTNAIGAEIGFAIAEGAMFSLGYNHLTNASAKGTHLYDSGLYFRFRLLLDNSLWDRLDSWLEN